MKYTYKVIEEKTWNKRGTPTNHFSYLQAGSIEEATKLAAKKYGLDNIVEVYEVSSVCNDWVKSHRVIEENAAEIYEEATGMIAEHNNNIVAVHEFSVGVIAEYLIDGQKQYETIIENEEYKSDDLDGMIDCLYNFYAKFEICRF